MQLIDSMVERLTDNLTQTFILYRTILAFMPDSKQGSFELTDNPGPYVLGHESVIGENLENNGIPSPRKRLTEAVDDSGIVDIRDSPALPVLSTK